MAANEEQNRSKRTELENTLCGLVDNLGLQALPLQPSTSDPISPPSISITSSKSNTSHSIDSTSLESTLLLQLTTLQISLLVKYTIDTNASYKKFKPLSISVQNAIIKQQITGEYFIQFSRPEFCKKLPNVKKGISAKIYKTLKSMTDSEIQQILQKCINSQYDSQDLKVNDNNDRKTSIRPVQLVILPNYISHEMIDINVILNGKKQVKNYNINEFTIYLYLILIQNEYNKTDIDIFMNGLIKLSLSCDMFLNMKRIVFCKSLKEYNILTAKAGKIYKLISKSIDENIIFKDIKIEWNNVKRILNYNEISDLAINNFHTTAYKMLSSMNESMKINNVNGKELIECYGMQTDLETYLQKNVRHKSVVILTDILWNDYINDKQHKLLKIGKYDRKELLKYFISLYISHIKNIIVKHKLDSNKCLLLKRKGVCKILKNNCGMSIGIATNIVDNIFRKIE